MRKIIEKLIRREIPNAPIGYISISKHFLEQVPFEDARASLMQFEGGTIIIFALPINEQGLWVWVKLAERRYLMANYILNEVGQRLIQELTLLGSRSEHLTRLVGEKLSMVELGCLAGMGTRGWNNLLLHPRFGPWLQIHALVTSEDIRTMETVVADVCIQCSNCIDACPAKAIFEDEFMAYRCSRLVASPGVGRSRAVSLTPNSYIECAECLVVCPIGSAPVEIFEWKR